MWAKACTVCLQFVTAGHGDLIVISQRRLPQVGEDVVTRGGPTVAYKQHMCHSFMGQLGAAEGSVSAAL